MNIFFYCLALIFIKINYIAFVCVCLWYIFQKTSILGMLLALQNPMCVLIITNYVNFYFTFDFNICNVAEFFAVCQTYEIHK